MSAFTAVANAADITFAAAYLVEAVRGRAALVAAVGVKEGAALAPRELQLSRSSPWPLEQVLRNGEPVIVDDVERRFPSQRIGHGGVTPRSALLYPLRDESTPDIPAVLLLGLHPRLKVDARYRDFLTLIGSTIAAKAAESDARQREHARLETLAALDRAKREFFSNVSHEFRTPLTLLLAPLEQMAQSLDDPVPARREDIEVMQRNARRLLRLVGTLLEFSEAEAGRLRPSFVRTDLARLTGEIAAMFRSAAASAGLTLTVDTPELSEPVWVDAEMWERVVSNLIANALKFTWKGRIDVSLTALHKHVQLVVRDTGVGIPAEQLPLVLKRFHRVPDVRGRTHEGSGIGLALVDELVRRHHGRIRVTSTLGEGTTVTVWLPLTGRRTTSDEEPTTQVRTGEVAAALADEAARWDADREERQAALGVEQPLVTNAFAVSTSGQLVMVVDDNADMREYLTRLLGEFWKIVPARTGEEAMALLHQQTPDLVVADVMLPGLDGLDLLAAVRADKQLATLPVVLLTARAGEEEAIEGLLAGADDYVVKPFSARELTARVAAQLTLSGVRRRAVELNQFRITLSDTLRALDDPSEIQQTACRMVVDQLGADRARYVELDEATKQFVTKVEYNAGEMSGALGRYSMADYAPLADAIHAGHRLVISDTQTDPFVAPIRDRLAALNIGAQLVIPLMRDGLSVAAFAVHQQKPRGWTDEDVAIAEESAGRAWAEVTRARAETGLRAITPAPADRTPQTN
jgi:signal transduction histidine kinase/DNA-binding response OmpR family regulator